MRFFNTLLVFLLMLPISLFGQGSFLSNGTGGGTWNSSTTWVLLFGSDSDTIPDANDDVIISGGDVVNYVNNYVDDITIVGTCTYSGSTSNTLRIQGNLNNLGSLGGNSSVYFQTSGGTISGSRYFGTSIRMRYEGNRTISSGVTAVWNKISSINNGVTLTNEGDIRFQAGVRSIYGGGGTFVNGSGGILRVRKNNLMTSGGILDLNNTGNTVIIEYTTALSLFSNHLSDEFYNLTISGSNVSASVDVEVLNDLVITSGDQLSSSGNDINVAGDVTRTGTLSMSAGDTLRLNGTAVQALSLGTMSIPIIVSDNPSTVSLSGGSVSITDYLGVEQGTFSVGTGALTINSDASGTGRIGPLCGTCDVAGTVAVERQIFGGVGLGNYTDMAVPFASGATLTEWDDDMYMSCVGGDDGDAWGPGGCYVSVKTYDDGAFSDMSSIGDALDEGRGYEVWLAIDLNDMNDTLISVDGIINDPGAITPPQTFDVGWQLVGNPYACQIDFDDITKGAGIGGSYLIFDSSTGNYEIFAGPIASSQGFWVEGTGGDMSFSFTQSCKTNAAATYVKSDVIDNNEFAMNIWSKNNDFSCKSVVKIDYDAVEERDMQDVSWLKSWVEEAPFIGTQSTDGVNLRVNSLSTTSDALSIPVVVRIGVTGDYIIDFENLNHFDSYDCVVLEDLATGATYDLRNNSQVTFSTKKVDEVDNRFTLHLSNDHSCKGDLALRTETDHVTILPNEFGANIKFEFPAETQANIALYDLVGKQVMDPITVDAFVSTSEIIVPTNLDGVYLMVVTSEYGQVTKKVFY